MVARTSPAPTTRDRILVEASRLFRKSGYHGASTRDIAAAVGIRQQSLRHHFPTKLAILEELLGAGLDEPLRVARAMRDCPGSPAVRLYAYIRFDTAHLQSSPYELEGLYDEPFLEDPALVEWLRRVGELHAALAAIISDGTAAGEFREVDAFYASTAIETLVERSMGAWSPRGRTPDLPLFVADFCLNALLRNPADLDRVKHEADAMSLGAPGDRSDLPLPSLAHGR